MMLKIFDVQDYPLKDKYDKVPEEIFLFLPFILKSLFKFVKLKS